MDNNLYLYYPDYFKEFWFYKNINWDTGFGDVKNLTNKFYTSWDHIKMYPIRLDKIKSTPLLNILFGD